jgi:phosphopantothenoylcysteine decarboxylase/phosphopantothenate--cysteine ligase
VPDHAPISHLALVHGADAYVVAPASANTVARLAHGMADSLVTTAALGATCPVLVAPAMNNHMLEHPATRANLATLRARGVTVVEPGTGALASRGEWGAGRLAEPADVLAAVERVLAPAGPGAPGITLGPLAAGGDDDAWSGLRVLVTAGGTREPIDAVRFVGNRSSGRMGLALAAVAAERGADVHLVAANVAAPAHPAVRRTDVGTAAELHAACLAHAPACDVVLMAAAVADFRPAAPAATKLKKTPGQETLDLVLERTPDVLAALAAERRPGQTLVGFAAEHGDGALDYGRDKLTRKGVDAIVVNDISRTDIGFDATANEVTIVTAEREVPVARAPKEDVAGAVLDEVARLRARVVAASV